MRLSSLTQLAVFLAVLGASYGLAQAPTGTIAGFVSDPSQAAISRARISVRNKQTGLVRVLTTSSEGEYSAPALPAGEYEVTAEAAGFRNMERTASVGAGNATRVAFAMQVGEATQVVNVEGAAPQTR